MADERPALGIDVGGGSAKIGIVSRAGAVLAESAVPSDPGLGAGELLDRYLAAAARLQEEASVPLLSGIGIGLPGHIDFAAGTTALCNVRALDGFPVVQYLAAQSGLNVGIENDATLAALGEFRFGAGRGSARFLAVTHGTGIGVGFIENGHPIHTAKGTMGDIGHAIVDPLGERRCRQGCHGCLESVASALAMEERFHSLRGEADDASPGLQGLFESARRGDGASQAIIAEAARAMGAAMATWLHIFAPDRIALAGGVSAAGDLMLAPVRAALSRFAMPDYLSGVALVSAQLGNRAGLIGAAALCFANRTQQRTDS